MTFDKEYLTLLKQKFYITQHSLVFSWFYSSEFTKQMLTKDEEVNNIRTQSQQYTVGFIQCYKIFCCALRVAARERTYAQFTPGFAYLVIK